MSTSTMPDECKHKFHLVSSAKQANGLLTITMSCTECSTAVEYMDCYFSAYKRGEEIEDTEEASAEADQEEATEQTEG